MGLGPFFLLQTNMLNNRIDSTELIRIADAVADENRLVKIWF